MCAYTRHVRSYDHNGSSQEYGSLPSWLILDLPLPSPTIQYHVVVILGSFFEVCLILLQPTPENHFLANLLLPPKNRYIEAWLAGPKITFSQ